MNFSSLLNKLKRSAKVKNQVFAVVQPNEVCASVNGVDFITVPITSDSWLAALTDALKQLDHPAGMAFNLVLSSQHYNTYQLATPQLPREEWPEALPFLLKDLIIERVTDIVADAHELPAVNKVQAYTLPKKTLESIANIAIAEKLELERIVPEEIIWKEIQKKNVDFMLLHRNSNGYFRLSAFINNTVCFQRTIRDVISPLTTSNISVNAQDQFDSLALELQRSVDYLSSQFKEAQIHQLFVCCDDEDEISLANELDQRLNARVSTLVDYTVLEGGKRDSISQLLNRQFMAEPANDINLYPTHLKPKKERLNLDNVAAVWGLIIALILIFYGYYNYKRTEIENELVQLKQKSQIMGSELSALQARFEQHSSSPEKQAAINRLKRDIAAKKSALKMAYQYDEAQQVGYSGVMASLSNVASPDISINQIHIESDALTIKGVALKPDSIPKWVLGFKDELNLAERTFNGLNIGYNDDGLVTFELKGQKKSEVVTKGKKK